MGPPDLMCGQVSLGSGVCLYASAFVSSCPACSPSWSGLCSFVLFVRASSSMIGASGAFEDSRACSLEIVVALLLF